MNQPAPSSKKTPTGAFVFAGVIIALFFIGLMGLLYYGVQRSDQPGRDALPSPLIGKPAPDFDLPLLHEPGKRFTLAELRGQPFVMNVWGSWCPECRVEHPVISKFALTKRVRFIGYNLKDPREDALRWLEQYGNPYLMVVADEEGRTAIDWGIYGAPETFLVDGSGIVRWKHVGAITDEIITNELSPALEKAEAGK